MVRRSKTLYCIAAVAALAGLATGCDPNVDAQTPAAGQTVVINEGTMTFQDTNGAGFGPVSDSIDVSGYQDIRVAAPPGGLVPGRVFLDEPSVTGTENAIMAAALAPGATTFVNAACEPHVQDLCRMLERMGVRIEGMGSNILTIHGAERLGGCRHDVGPDHIEIASFIGLAAVTGGDVVIEDVEPEDLLSVRFAFERLGVACTLEGDHGRDLRVAPGQRLEIVDDIGGQIPKIEDGPWPQVPADITSILVAVATQARGTVLIHEKMFENRLVFTDKLVSMGARIVLCDPHRALITGPTRLHGSRVDSPDIRAGMAMVIAAACATGTTVVGNVQQIDRGYERIDDDLLALGARIERAFD